jgi:hypothetical protein
MKKQSSGNNVKEPFFTVEDHLGVQHQIEEHAHAIWYAGGCRHGCALSDWLMAEGVVLEQFIRAYAHRQALRQSPRQRAAVNNERRGPQSGLALAGATYEHDV